MTEKKYTYIIKIEQYDPGSQEGYIGFYMVTAPTLKEAKEKTITEFKENGHYISGLGQITATESCLYEFNKHFNIDTPIMLDYDNYNWKRRMMWKRKI